MSFKDLLNENRWLTDDYAHGEALYQVAYEFERQQERINALERRIEALEKRCGKIAAFSYGDNDSRIKDHERRIEAMERKLNHKGGDE